MAAKKKVLEVTESEPGSGIGIQKEVSGFDVYVGEQLIRSYSVDVHGKDAEKLAQQYVQTNGGEVRSHQVEA